MQNAWKNLNVEQKQTKEKTTLYINQVNENTVLVLVPSESSSWSSAKVDTVTILLEADIALLSNSDFAILISFHSWGVTLKLSLPKSFVKYYVAVYWVITGQYCETVNCDWRWIFFFLTCSVLHSSDICLSIYLGNSCSGKLNILSIEFQIREVVVLLTVSLKGSKLLTSLSTYSKEPCECVCFLLNVIALPHGPNGSAALILLKSMNLY